MTRIAGTGLAALLALAACGDETPNDNAKDDTVVDGNLSCDGDVCFISGEITEDLTLTADTTWVLRGGVFVGDDAEQTVLTIEPGTTIYGETSSDAFLAIRRGSRIEAIGTADAPIVFTSSKTEGSRARGDWGGLILNGRAPVNTCGGDTACDVIGEGGTGVYGGDDADDNSGTLRYVRVEFAGTLVDSENELNGIAFQGVGRGTTVDHVQVHMNADDGVEFFGGTVDIRNVLITGAGDDLLDWTDGWQGRGQYIVLQAHGDAGDNGIEADNNAELSNATPRSEPWLMNLSIFGAPGSDDSDAGLLLREGTGGHFSHLIVAAWTDACVDIDHEATFAHALDGSDLSGGLTLSNGLFDCDGGFPADSDDFGAITVDDIVLDANEGNATGEAGVVAPFDEKSADFTLAADAAAWIDVDGFDDDFFDAVDFVGAMGTEDWTAGWTTDAPN